ncbi:MAG: 26S proteasome regulatory subunit rpn6 [Alectoria sarmentosa]|nr:MAG: 26S proteasome regulatory subunit rpn6 [Alectoria sarmentosa]
MAPAPTDSAKVQEAKKLGKTDPLKAEAIYKEILSKKPGASEAALREYESALMGLGESYRDTRKTDELAELVRSSTSSLSSFTKAKTAKLVRQLLDLFSSIPNTVDVQISVTKSCIEWAISERRSFLRQNLETRLVSLYMQKQSYYDALTLINGLLKELKRLDDKLVLVEVQLLESRVYHALGNQPKARAALTSARTSAASVYTPPLLQAGLDMQSGMLHAEDKDFNTAFSYFIEALEGYHSQEETQKATSALQYMLLCKIMLNLVDDVNNLMTSKQAMKYSGKNLEAMKAVARAHSNRSLEDYEKALANYRYELGSDVFIRNHLKRLYDSMLEQNLIKVIEPFSRVEIDHIAKMVGLDTQQVERKLSQMILDRVIIGVLDQGAGCLIVYDEAERDQGYDAALETIEKLSNVVDTLAETVTETDAAASTTEEVLEQYPQILTINCSPLDTSGSATCITTNSSDDSTSYATNIESSLYSVIFSVASDYSAASSTTATSATPSPTSSAPTAKSTTTSSPKSSSSTTAHPPLGPFSRVGIGLGVPLGACALAGVALLLYRHGKHKERSRMSQMGNLAPPGGFFSEPEGKRMSEAAVASQALGRQPPVYSMEMQG